MAGYSGTSLRKKLGIEPGHRLALVGAPEGFLDTLGELPVEVKLQAGLRGKTPLDVIVLFSDSRRELERRLPEAQKRMTPAAGLWVAWPKKASGVATDVSEELIREIALPRGLVDNKVCAIDETWSGLRLVIRRENRR